MPGNSGRLFYGMVAPFANYSVRGHLWYQGMFYGRPLCSMVSRYVCMSVRPSPGTGTHPYAPSPALSHSHSHTLTYTPSPTPPHSHTSKGRITCMAIWGTARPAPGTAVNCLPWSTCGAPFGTCRKGGAFLRSSAWPPSPPGGAKGTGSTWAGCDGARRRTMARSPTQRCATVSSPRSTILATPGRRWGTVTRTWTPTTAPSPTLRRANTVRLCRVLLLLLLKYWVLPVHVHV